MYMHMYVYVHVCICLRFIILSLSYLLLLLLLLSFHLNVNVFLRRPMPCCCPWKDLGHPASEGSNLAGRLSSFKVLYYYFSFLPSLPPYTVSVTGYPPPRALLLLGSRRASPSGGDRTWQRLRRWDRLLLDPTAAGSAPLGVSSGVCCAPRRRRGPLWGGLPSAVAVSPLSPFPLSLFPFPPSQYFSFKNTIYLSILY